VWVPSRAYRLKETVQTYNSHVKDESMTTGMLADANFYRFFHISWVSYYAEGYGCFNGKGFHFQNQHILLA